MHFVDAKGILTGGKGHYGMNICRGCPHGRMSSFKLLRNFQKQAVPKGLCRAMPEFDGKGHAGDEEVLSPNMPDQLLAYRPSLSA